MNVGVRTSLHMRMSMSMSIKRRELRFKGRGDTWREGECRRQEDQYDTIHRTKLHYTTLHYSTLHYITPYNHLEGRLTHILAHV